MEKLNDGFRLQGDKVKKKIHIKYPLYSKSNVLGHILNTHLMVVTHLIHFEFNKNGFSRHSDVSSLEMESRIKSRHE